MMPISLKLQIGISSRLKLYVYIYRRLNRAKNGHSKHIHKNVNISWSFHNLGEELIG